jgi:glycopeptide antibiotics resistance protein
LLRYFSQQGQFSFLVTLVLIGIFLVSNAPALRRRDRQKFVQSSSRFGLVWALSLILIFTLDPLGVRAHAVRSLNVIPFSGSEYAKNSLDFILGKIGFNIVLFLPLGFLLKLAAGKSFACSAMTGCFVSIGVETVQYIAALGSSATSDVVMNTAGTTLGAGLAVVIDMLVQRSRNRKLSVRNDHFA